MGHGCPRDYWQGAGVTTSSIVDDLSGYMRSRRLAFACAWVWQADLLWFCVQKARLPASTSASKLAVPRPVNLPSLRKVCLSLLARALPFSYFVTGGGQRLMGQHRLQENAGNDPNTQIVPSGSGSSWQRVEESAPAPADPKTALTAGSTWASTQSKDSGWQPPAPAITTLPPPRPGSRSLNPHEYPSLSAAASGRQQSLPKQRVPSVPDTQVIGTVTMPLQLHKCSA